MRRNDVAKAAETFLAKHNITWRYENGAKHIRLVFQHAGRQHFIAIHRGSICNDRRLPHHTVRNLRHALGLVGRPA